MRYTVNYTVRYTFLFILFFCLRPTTSRAVPWFFSFGYGQGGTLLSNVTGGQGFDTEAGSGYLFEIGALLVISPTTPHRFEGQIGLGYLFKKYAPQDENAITWSRTPIEAMYFYRNTRELFRLGWGLTYHLDNQLSGKGTYAGASMKVDNALGWVVAVEKLFPIENGSEKTFSSLGFRYQWIKYHSQSFTRDPDGSVLMGTYSFLVR